MIKESKRCSICGVVKSRVEFHVVRDARHIHGEYLQGRCRDCSRAYLRNWTKTDRGRELRKAQARRTNLASYGLTEEAYAALMESQGGGCAICSSTSNDSSGRNMSIDHDHETGEVRGILCHSCNVAIGLLKENQGLFAKAAHYLAKRRKLRVV